MISLTIAPDFKAKIPKVVVGWITANVRNSQHDEALWQEIEAIAARFRGMTMDAARKFLPMLVLLYVACRRAPIIAPLVWHTSSYYNWGNLLNHDRVRYAI